MNLSPELINESSLKEWFDTQGLGKGEDISFERVKAGESNEVFIVKIRDRFISSHSDSTS